MSDTASGVQLFAAEADKSLLVLAQTQPVQLEHVPISSLNKNHLGLFSQIFNLIIQLSVKTSCTAHSQMGLHNVITQKKFF